ncbi:MAG: MarR family transcriptional regulator, partial [Bacteroidetes bacterium]|nr:MarR family transcriptional regulator [Bacteroidota bacterium]
HTCDRRQVDIKINQAGIDLIDKIEVEAFAELKKLSDFNEEKAKLMNEWLDDLRS